MRSSATVSPPSRVSCSRRRRSKVSTRSLSRRARPCPSTSSSTRARSRTGVPPRTTGAWRPAAIRSCSAAPRATSWRPLRSHSAAEPARDDSSNVGARLAVTKGIKTALERIGSVHPALDAHLDATVRRFGAGHFAGGHFGGQFSGGRFTGGLRGPSHAPVFSHGFHRFHRGPFFFHHRHGFSAFFAFGLPVVVPFYAYPPYSYYYDPYCDPYSPYYDPNYCSWRHRVY